MKIFGSMAIAFSMYSKIPMPRTDWTKERMEYAMCFFPLVGAVIGILYLIMWRAAAGAGLSAMATACFGTVLPILVTGGIHMDGFADTVDALSSYQPMEKKLEILKDPHAGAFAVIGCVTYMILTAGLFSEINERGILLLAGVPVMSRAFSGLSVVRFPKAKKSGLAAMFADGARTGAVTAAMAAYLVLAVIWFFAAGGPAAAVFLAAAGALGFIHYYRLGKKQFGGITGDIAGYFLQLEELILLFVIVVITKAGI